MSDMCNQNKTCHVLVIGFLQRSSYQASFQTFSFYMKLPCEAWEHQATQLLKTSRQYEDDLVSPSKTSFNKCTTRISDNFRVVIYDTNINFWNQFLDGSHGLSPQILILDLDDYPIQKLTLSGVCLSTRNDVAWQASAMVVAPRFLDW